MQVPGPHLPGVQSHQVLGVSILTSSLGKPTELEVRFVGRGRHKAEERIEGPGWRAGEGLAALSEKC